MAPESHATEDGEFSPPLVSPLAPTPAPPMALAEVGDAVGAAESPLSTAVIVGATALGLGCVLCTAIACAYRRAWRKRAASPASTLVRGRSTPTHILGVGGDQSDAASRASKSLPPESLPTVIELGSIIELVSSPGLVTTSTPMEHWAVYPDAAPDLTGQGNVQPLRGAAVVSSQSAGAGAAALERARRARRGPREEEAYM